MSSSTPDHPAAASPRRLNHAVPSSPRHRAIPTRFPSYSDVDPRTNVVLGFSPPNAGLPSLAEASHPDSARVAPLPLHATNYKLAHLSPQLSTPIEQTFPTHVFPTGGPDGSPRFFSTSPRAAGQELPPRSRRNSAAIVSISLSSRPLSRTPRGSSTHLPGSGQGTPNKGSSTVTPRADDGVTKPEVFVQMSGSDPWAQGSGDDFDDWRPTGGMLLGSDEDTGEDDLLDDKADWAIVEEESNAPVKDVLKPGMLFGEGLEFQGEVIAPAVGKVSGESSDEGMPLRRGGSEAPKALRGMPGVHHHGRDRKVYEVVRQLGSGSYAVVYLVREKGGRKREYALKCLSKQDLEPEQIDTQLFEATIHLSLPIHKNIVTLHQTLQTKKWLFLMLELCPGEDLFFWLEKSRDASPPPANAHLPGDRSAPMSSSKFSSSSIPFSSSQLFGGLNGHLGSSFSNSPRAFSPSYSASPASLIFAHNNNNNHSPHHFQPSMTPPTPSLLSAFSANTLLSSRRLRLIASMFSQMCESVAVCHDAGVSHRDIKPENFICCDSIELESAAEGDVDFGPQAKRKVVVKLTDFGLATTDEESGDVECGSKPYMSYECRNNLGPTYYPPAADVWSLGIVLINMLFHRNPWKDPTEGDPNFDNFLGDPTNFLLSKFTGIGREVASYLACHVLCTEVEDRVTACDFGKWVKSLPEMIGGRKAIRDLKMARLETRNERTVDQSLFTKSPVQTHTDVFRKTSASALTSSAPMLSQLGPASSLSHQASTLITPDLIDGDGDGDEMRSATTVDEQPTPIDTRAFSSPDEVDPSEKDIDESVDAGDSDTRSLSTHKRRKRGVRKGKAAQAAIAAAAAGDAPSQGEKDAMLKELAQASQSLARHLSKTSRPSSVIDSNDTLDFPPLGTTPSQAAAAKKSKWKDMMKMTAGNPELAALARRVAERNDQSFGTWSAPAKMQHSSSQRTSSGSYRHNQTATFSSSGVSSTISTIDPVSTAATSTSDGTDEDNWRAKAAEAKKSREREKKDEDKERARKANAAAMALMSEPMGAFGANRPLAGGNPGHPRSGLAHPPRPPAATAHSHSFTSHRLQTIDDEDKATTARIAPAQAQRIPSKPEQPYQLEAKVSVETASAKRSASSVESTASTISADPPHRPKLKGQIQSLAKMLSGLKTKGKD